MAVWFEPSSTVTTSSKFRPISDEPGYLKRRSSMLVGARPCSVAVRLRSAHVCRVLDDVRSVTTFRTCSRGRFGTHGRDQSCQRSSRPGRHGLRPGVNRGPGAHRFLRFPCVKAHTASHRTCASSSVRHDTTSLPFLSFFLTLPTPPPRTPLAPSRSGRDFCLSRDDSWGETW